MERTYVDNVPEHAEDDAASAWVTEESVIDEGAAMQTTALTLAPELPTRSALARISQAGAWAWRQPAVRSAVRTGASAVALSMALRIAGRLVTSRNARQLATQAALPGLRELLESSAERQAAYHGREAEVTETFIYVRRITRR